jgi:hypothetical protein
MNPSGSTRFAVRAESPRRSRDGFQCQSARGPGIAVMCRYKETVRCQNGTLVDGAEHPSHRQQVSGYPEAAGGVRSG